MDLETVPQVGGQSLFELELEPLADKPWRMPGECAIGREVWWDRWLRGWT